MQHLLITVAVAVGISIPVTALAQEAAAHASHHIAQGQTNAAVALTQGEVRSVDKEGGRITLKHGTIENLGMPPMTMVFRAKDPAMLNQFKSGDKVKFAAEQIGGQLTVTRIERLP